MWTYLLTSWPHLFPRTIQPGKVRLLPSVWHLEMNEHNARESAEAHFCDMEIQMLEEQHERHKSECHEDERSFGRVNNEQ